MAATALPQLQHLLGDAGVGIHVEPPSTRNVCRKKRAKKIIKYSAMLTGIYSLTDQSCEWGWRPQFLPLHTATSLQGLGFTMAARGGSSKADSHSLS